MKKMIVLVFLMSLGTIQSCLCPNTDFSTTYITIESAKGLFYSFNENGVFPYLDSFNRKELGISIFHDSISERIEVAQLPTLINAAYACQDPDVYEYVNYIDSVNVFTQFNFDENHPAGSNVNDILDPLDIMGETYSGVDIESLELIEQHMKFSAIPTYDSMQFLITARIVGKGYMHEKTKLVILND